MSFETQFPAFPVAEIPAFIRFAVASGYMVDASWCNEACPSFDFIAPRDGNADSNYTHARVFCDRLNPADRDYEGVPRFSVEFYHADGKLEPYTAFSTESETEIAKYLGEVMRWSNEYRDHVGHCPFLDDPQDMTPSKAKITLAEYRLEAACEDDTFGKASADDVRRYATKIATDMGLALTFDEDGNPAFEESK